MRTREPGIDLARALAIAGMVIVNFHLVLAWPHSSGGWALVADSLQGRAVALFVVLAGVGLSQAVQRATDPVALRWRVARRGLWLVVLGLCFVPIWPADILHFYGLYFLLAIPLLWRSDRWLWAVMLSLMLGFVALVLMLDYEAGWDFATLEYRDFWTPEGFIRHLLFNGFHPLIPWAALLLLGLWLGRRDLTSGRIRTRLMVVGLLLWGLAEALSSGLVAGLRSAGTGLDAEDIEALFGTEPMPPMPLYLIGAGGLAVAIVAACVSVSRLPAMDRWLMPVARMGRLSLTWYVLHVLLGMGLIESVSGLNQLSAGVVLACSLLFVLLAMLGSMLWLTRFSNGPLEGLFRRLSG